MRPPRTTLSTFSIWTILAAAVLLLAPAGAEAAARLSAAEGSVELGRGEPPAWAPARAGDALEAGDLVRTGEDGRAELELGRATLRLYPNSLLRVPAGAVGPTGADAVELEKGTSLFDVLRGERPFEVRTPEVVVSVKGTRFSVSLDSGAASVAVFRGLVGVRSLVAEAVHETLVREGFRAAGRDSFELSVHSLGDPWEAWSAGRLGPVAPPPLRQLPGSAEFGLERARELVRTSGRAEAVSQAVKRHPNVARELSKQSPAHRAIERRLRRPKTPQVPLDPVADDRQLSPALQTDFLETWLNGGQPTGPGAPTPPFDVTFVSGGGAPGPDYVDLTSLKTSTSWNFTGLDLYQIQAGGQSFPPNLLTELQGAGINNPQLFAHQLLQLFQ